MGAIESEAMLESVQPFYAAARRLHDELQALQTVDQAYAAYNTLLGGEERHMETLRQRVASLEREKQLLIEQLELSSLGYEEAYGEADEIVSRRDERHIEESRKEEQGVKEESINPIRLTRARERFQRLVNRFSYFLGVNDTVRAQINQIVGNPERPLGEALLLLDWDAFRNRIDPPGSESDERYCERLKDWRESLREYIEKAEGDVRAIEVRYGGPRMRIWKAWRDVDSGDPSKWEQLIKDTRTAFAHQGAEFEKQIAALEADIADLKAKRSGGTHG